MIKYYDRPQKYLEKKHFQQQVDMKIEDNESRKMSNSDFENQFNFAKELRRKIPDNAPKDSQDVKNFIGVVESLIDIVLTVNQRDLDRGLNQTL